MEREIDLNQISDGKLYLANDMVRTGCNECAGCSSCCRGMGDSIILDPYDMYSMEQGLGVTFESLMEDKIALNVVDGIILLSAFPCGPDSMVNELVTRRVKGVPLLNLVLDSQTGTAGVETRLESFIDIIRFKKGAL